MHGMIFLEFRDFGRKLLGWPGWDAVTRETGVGTTAYRPDAAYPDEDLVGLVLACARRSEQRVDEVLTAFGRYAAPGLLDTFGAFVAPEWRTHDLVLNTERVIHRAVRLQEPTAAPPRLTASRRSGEEISVVYTSPRRLCAFGKGLIFGIAEHYGEEVSITEPTCMHLGDAQCELIVRS